MSCFCDYPDTCDGSGVLTCSGCGGDLCICAECSGHGETDCDGCEACDPVGEITDDEVAAEWADEEQP